MRILIIGAGKGGWHLTEILCQEKHDVVVIDQDPRVLETMEAHLDVLTICGHGTSPRVLEEAEIGKADLLVAVTDRDEVNILACLYARVAGVKHRIARITNQDFLARDSRLDLADAGVDLVVSKAGTTADELNNILRLPGATEVVNLLDGQVQVIGIRVGMDSPLLRAPLSEVAEPDMLHAIRSIAVMRGDELIIPRGDTRFLIGDDVYVISRPDYIPTFLRWACPGHTPFAKIIIAGGGDLGMKLAQLLEGAQGQVVLVESDADRALRCSSILGRTLVIHGDALNEEILQNAGIVDDTAFVAATGNDENNIIGCMLAEKLGASYTLAQISKDEYVSIINSQSLLDRAVSPYTTMGNAILHFIRGRNIKSATLLHRLPGELLEIVLPERNRWNGAAIKDIKLAKGTVIAAVKRGLEVMIPTGDLVLEAGDQLAVFARPAAVGKIQSLFRG